MDDRRITKIKALLAKAEDAAATEAERETYREKANELIVLWEIDEARLTAAGDDRLKDERIVSRTVVPDVPPTYGYEFSLIGARVADALGMRGLMTKKWRNGTWENGRPVKRDKLMSAYLITGFESDVERGIMLIQSLIVQCSAALATWAADRRADMWYADETASERYQARRGFITGFSEVVASRLQTLRAARVSETVGSGTDLVLVNRSDRVEAWVAENLKVGRGRSRRYDWSGADAGAAAGAKADVGQSRFGTGARGSLEG